MIPLIRPLPDADETLPAEAWGRRIAPAAGGAGLDGGASAGAVIRLLAHELRQPLSSLQSIAYYLDLTMGATDPRTREQLVKLQQLVAEANQIITDATAGFDAPRLACQAVDLESMIARKVERREEPQRKRLRFSPGGCADLVYADPAQLSKLLDSLLNLAINLAREDSLMDLRTARLLEGVGLEVRFDALSCTAADLAHPFAGSIPVGCSFSLAGAQRIIASHGGQMWAAQENESGRISLWISVPVSNGR
jgi:signal transduction histidine kinase